jgi:hypothetical protein
MTWRTRSPPNASDADKCVHPTNGLPNSQKLGLWRVGHSRLALVGLAARACWARALAARRTLSAMKSRNRAAVFLAVAALATLLEPARQGWKWDVGWGGHHEPRDRTRPRVLAHVYRCTGAHPAAPLLPGLATQRCAGAVVEVRGAIADVVGSRACVALLCPCRPGYVLKCLMWLEDGNEWGSGAQGGWRCEGDRAWKCGGVRGKGEEASGVRVGDGGRLCC